MNIGFKTRIYLGVGLLVTISLIVLGTLNIVSMKEKMVSSLVSETRNKLNFHVTELEQLMQFRINAIAEASTQFTSSLSDDGNQNLVSLLAKSTGISNVIMTYDDGRNYMSLPSSNRFDFRDREWYKAAKAATGVALTGIYDDKVTGEKVISVTMPVLEGGQFVGVLLGDIQLGEVIKTVSSMRFAGGAATLTDHDAVFFASDDPNDIGRTPSQVSANFADMERMFSAQQSGHLTFPYLGIQFDGYFQRVNLTNNMYWTLMVFVDQATALQSVDKAEKEAIGTGFILFVISFGAIFVILHYAYKPLLGLKSAVLGLSQGNGDLTQRLEVSSHDDLGQISQGFNQFVESLQQMMLQISQASESISSSLIQLGETAKENESQLLTHSSETEQVVTAITQMSESARTVAESVHQSNRITESASKEAQSSLSIVNNAVSTVSTLVTEVEDMSSRIVSMKKDANRISDVLTVIGEISEQTNLLALNAAIEAARAGEQGRGFAVVADEVRALAARTQNSTTEISDMLVQLLDGTDNVVKAMETTKGQCQSTAEKTSDVSESLGVMSVSVKEIDDVSTQIAAATEEQSTVAEELSRNMLSISEIVTSLVSSGQQTVVATESLGGTNQELERLVANFKLR
ncbi:methyl-accepting chemotaxis protein [Vibrio ostreicida]|uniref:Methyl-accepting chemotaxis protein n=1 Tax=Vibrio ostreicida TaxID=526588 RepID=A0ABT8BTR2_9VIBR|nr:methyl-accepting chemotaxis protein [Vibrio ostreicida]MDN3610381.1 methyl-accepting chemotaxis protein [Vibrio ostreicida]NPD07608.1 methyl-accepting chemotaxis protein [Vibrio ostreicida]